MITELQLQNFKCFKQSSVFAFSKLNLLTGINGRGKSTLLQSLLLLSQSAYKDPSYKTLIINDELIELGNFDDIKNSEAHRGEHIIFNINSDDYNGVQAIITYSENESNPLIAQLVEIEIIADGKSKTYDKNGFKFGDNLEAWLSRLLCRTHYISADRLGSVKYVDKVNLPEHVTSNHRGENVVNILNSDNLPLVHQDLYIGNDAKTVIQQTEEWLGYILEGAKIEIKGKEKESSVLYMLMNNKKNAYRYKPANMGFGYSYILPLIVEGLLSQKDEKLIVENPEAHLHPRAQSRLAEFFARVASTGVQVFIESHSEHILNGLRVCALNPDINIRNTDLSILYFNEGFEPEKLEVDEKGKIANWPEGFFDQQEIDLSNIFKFGR